MRIDSAALLSKLQRADYYAVLGVTRTAQAADIKRAFYRVALLCHPDRYDGNDPAELNRLTSIYKLAVEAYVLLLDARRRPLYDAMLERGVLRFDDTLAVEVSQVQRSSSLAARARTPEAQQLAARAQHHWQQGELEAACALLVSACRLEQGNRELKASLDELYQRLEAS